MDEQAAKSLALGELPRRPEQRGAGSTADRCRLDKQVDELSLGRIAGDGEEPGDVALPLEHMGPQRHQLLRPHEQLAAAALEEIGAVAPVGLRPERQLRKPLCFFRAGRSYAAGAGCVRHPGQASRSSASVKRSGSRRRIVLHRGATRAPRGLLGEP